MHGSRRSNMSFCSHRSVARLHHSCIRSSNRSHRSVLAPTALLTVPLALLLASIALLFPLILAPIPPVCVFLCVFYVFLTVLSLYVCVCVFIDSWVCVSVSVGLCEKLVCVCMLNPMIPDIHFLHMVYLIVPHSVWCVCVFNIFLTVCASLYVYVCVRDWYVSAC
jgi:hypothetical protein